MILERKDSNRILIIGDAGRGKTTLGYKLKEKLNFPFYSTDDYFFKVKFSVLNDRKESIEKIKEEYKRDKWIIEGSTTHLIQPGIEHADLIILMKFPSIFHQWTALIKRNIYRKDKSVLGLLKYLIYVARKRFGIGYKRTITYKDMLGLYESKIIRINSYKEADSFLSNI